MKRNFVKSSTIGGDIQINMLADFINLRRIIIQNLSQVSDLIKNIFEEPCESFSEYRAEITQSKEQDERIDLFYKDDENIFLSECDIEDNRNLDFIEEYIS